MTWYVVYSFKPHALNKQGLFERRGFALARHYEAALVPELTEAIPGPDRWNKTLDRIRKQIETGFSVLVGSFTLHGAQVKTFHPLGAKVNLKIAVHNLVCSKVLFKVANGAMVCREYHFSPENA